VEPKVKEFKRTLLEFLIIVLAGLGIGLAANAVSPRRLPLTKNFFPPLPPPLGTRPSSGPASQPGPTSNPTTQMASQAVIEEIKQLGFQVLKYDDMKALYKGQFYKDGIYIAVDARNSEHYRDGHIPGAYHLDRYSTEDYMPKVLEACKTAEKVAVYCNGGDCDESKWVAFELSMAGVPSYKLGVYIGGITEWQEKGDSVESGDRNSGTIVGGGRK
jgi:rhodanese-related sulfurtransferase